MEDWDIQMQVKLCSTHRKFYDKKVWVDEKKKYIYPSALVDLLKEVRLCLSCVWETKLPKSV